MPLQKMFAWILSYKGLMNSVFCQQLESVKNSNIVHLMPDPTVNLVRSGASRTATSLR